MRMGWCGSWSSDKAWMQQMESMSGVLERELAKIAGVEVSEIHFEVKRY